MYHCEEFGVPCLVTEYEHFDEVCSSELKKPISVHEIINESDFCTVLPIEILKEADGAEVLTINDHLKGLKGRSGIYHLWVSMCECDDHGINSMLCVYVGKGIAESRVLSHVKNKWPESQFLWVTFYECENRISKYLEQLFLDTYSFYLNTYENTGTGYLYARWSADRTWNGTEFDSMVNIRTERMSDES
ncbi:hypothetical protein [Halomonas salipaludis]|uniref:hypothetical protein n=1 Tax=Halomonas salipaludis TaxID=2032625 RepID=UPI001140E1E3|nr:hypothetical protein [Halomonas salipaludis]